MNQTVILQQLLVNHKFVQFQVELDSIRSSEIGPGNQQLPVKKTNFGIQKQICWRGIHEEERKGIGYYISGGFTPGRVKKSKNKERNGHRWEVRNGWRIISYAPTNWRERGRNIIRKCV